MLRLAFNLMYIQFLYNKSFDEKDTFQCHLLQSLKIISDEFNSMSHKQLNSTIARLLKRIKLVWYIKFVQDVLSVLVHSLPRVDKRVSLRNRLAGCW